MLKYERFDILNTTKLVYDAVRDINNHRQLSHAGEWLKNKTEDAMPSSNAILTDFLNIWAPGQATSVIDDIPKEKLYINKPYRICWHEYRLKNNLLEYQHKGKPMETKVKFSNIPVGMSFELHQYDEIISPTIRRYRKIDVDRAIAINKDGAIDGDILYIDTDTIVMVDNIDTFRVICNMSEYSEHGDALDINIARSNVQKLIDVVNDVLVGYDNIELFFNKDDITIICTNTVKTKMPIEQLYDAIILNHGKYKYDHVLYTNAMEIIRYHEKRREQ